MANKRIWGTEETDKPIRGGKNTKGDITEAHKKERATTGTIVVNMIRGCKKAMVYPLPETLGIPVEAWRCERKTN